MTRCSRQASCKLPICVFHTCSAYPTAQQWLGVHVHPWRCSSASKGSTTQTQQQVHLRYSSGTRQGLTVSLYLHSTCCRLDLCPQASHSLCLQQTWNKWCLGMEYCLHDMPACWGQIYTAQGTLFMANPMHNEATCSMSPSNGRMPLPTHLRASAAEPTRAQLGLAGILKHTTLTRQERSGTCDRSAASNARTASRKEAH